MYGAVSLCDFCIRGCQTVPLFFGRPREAGLGRQSAGIRLEYWAWPWPPIFGGPPLRAAAPAHGGRRRGHAQRGERACWAGVAVLMLPGGSGRRGPAKCSRLYGGVPGNADRRIYDIYLKIPDTLPHEHLGLSVDVLTAV